MSWGIDGLNLVTGGIHQGRMVLLTSRPSVGKTSLAGSLLVTVAEQFLDDVSARVVKYFSLEMPAEKIQHRLASQMSRVPMHRIDTGYATAEQRERYEQAQRTLAELPIEYFDDHMSLAEVEREIRESDTGWWILDHTGVLADFDDAQTPYLIHANISERLRRLSQKVKTGLIIHHQNRSKQNATDKRADLESLAGADKYGKDADLALGLYRDDVGKYVSEEEKDLPKPGELLVIKNRDGSQGFGIEMIFLPKTAQWVEKSKQLTVVKPEAM